MDDLTRVLWKYAAECRLEACYDRTMQEERRENEQALSQNRKRLKELCPAPVLERVEDLCYYLEVLRAVDQEAAFACGLHIGLSLR